jgi:hypothetical protein
MTTGQQQAPARRDEREDEFWRNPLAHLSACLTVGALVILVIFAINWLT